MKFELKTENEFYSKSFSNFFKTIFSLSLFIIFCDVALKLGIIARHYQIDYQCRRLTVEKSPSTFNKLSKLARVKSKQRVWEFCREVVR